MRAFYIASICFVFFASMSAVNDTGFFMYAPPNGTATTWNDTFTDVTGWLNETQRIADDSAEYRTTFGDIPRSMRGALTVFGQSTVLIPFFLLSLGFPASVVWPITFLIWLIYTIAILQILRGFSGGATI